MTSTILMSEQDVERVYGIKRRQLQTLRLRGSGPLYLKLGASVRYRAENIDAWLSASERTSTSDAA